MTHELWRCFSKCLQAYNYRAEPRRFEVLEDEIMAESLRSIIEGMECTCHHCCQYLEANGTVPCDCSCVKCRLLAVLTEEKVDLVKKWKNIADQFSHGPMPNPLARSVFLRCAVELETWLAVNLERIKAQARLEGRRASLDYVSGVIAGCSKFGEDEVLKGCVEEEYERIGAWVAPAMMDDTDQVAVWCPKAKEKP